MEQHSTHSNRMQDHYEDDRSTEAIRRDIERRRASIARTVDQAGQKLHQSMSWREQVREHPYGALAAAAVAGLALSSLTPPPATSAERLAMLLTGTALPRPGLARGLRAALTALATQSVMGALRRQVGRGSTGSNDSEQTGSAPAGAIAQERTRQ